MILTLSLLCAASIASGLPVDAAAPLELRAHVSTAGPYGESWELKLGRDGKARLQILYMLPPMGKMEGDFLVSETALAELRKTIAAERFGDLPKSIWPGAASFHLPDFRLSVTLGNVTHEVWLYDPAQFAKDQRVVRFMAVWNKAFALVPLRPSW
jgi:hypothetical protein